MKTLSQMAYGDRRTRVILIFGFCSPSLSSRHSTETYGEREKNGGRNFHFSPFFLSFSLRSNTLNCLLTHARCCSLSKLDYTNRSISTCPSFRSKRNTFSPCDGTGVVDCFVPSPSPSHATLPGSFSMASSSYRPGQQTRKPIERLGGIAYPSCKTRSYAR